MFWEVPGTFEDVPGVFGKFRVFLGSSGCVWEVPGVFRKFPGVLRKFPGCCGKFPGRFRKFPGVLESCQVLGPKKHVLRSFVFAKKSDKKQKLVISDRCFMLNLRESEVPPLDHESLIRRLEI